MKRICLILLALLVYAFSALAYNLPCVMIVRGNPYLFKESERKTVMRTLSDGEIVIVRSDITDNGQAMRFITTSDGERGFVVKNVVRELSVGQYGSARLNGSIRIYKSLDSNAGMDVSDKRPVRVFRTGRTIGGVTWFYIVTASYFYGYVPESSLIDISGDIEVDIQSFEKYTQKEHIIENEKERDIQSNNQEDVIIFFDTGTQ